MAERAPDTEAGNEAALTPHERALQAMNDIGAIIEANFITDAQKAAFMINLELRIGPDGKLITGGTTNPDEEAQQGYRNTHIIQFTELNMGGDEPAERDIKVHMPEAMVGHQYEYTHSMPEDAVKVQRTMSDEGVSPQREGDAVYLEWIRDNLGTEVERLRRSTAADQEEEPELAQLQRTYDIPDDPTQRDNYGQ